MLKNIKMMLKDSKILHPTVIMTVSSLFIPLSVWAGTPISNSTSDSTNNTYIGLKGGMISVDNTQRDELDNSFIYGVYTGYYFNDNFALEMDYSKSTKADISGTLGQGDYQISNYGAYIAYRYPINSNDLHQTSTLYAKSKLGFAGAEIDRKFSQSISFDDVGIAGGLGLGWQVKPNFAIETEFNMLSSDIDNKSITFGTHFQF